MKQAISPESLSDAGHSCNPQGSESNATGSRVKSAAMLGLALSVGASGVLVSQAEASAAVSTPTTSETTKAFSSDSQVSADENAGTGQSAQSEIVAYHTVESGESLWQIAQQHRIGLRDLKSANNLPPETAIHVGQVLRVPASNIGVHISAQSVASSEAQEVFPTSQIVIEDASASATAESASAARTPSTLSKEATSTTTSSSTPSTYIEAHTISARGESLSASEAELASAQIEIASASVQAESASATTLATAQSFSRYQVRAGDTLASIASSLGTTSEEIMGANNLVNPNVIIAGTIIRVPGASEQSTVSKTDTSIRQLPSGDFPNVDSERLARLRDTAVRPEASPLLEEIRSVSPAEPDSVGGAAVTEQNVIGADAAGPLSERQSADPYVVNLLEDVQAVRETSVRISEASSEIESSSNSGDRPSLLASSTEQIVSESDAEQAAFAPTAADAELLAAAPLSPDAYIPAQRPATGQVVSPDMPLLPEADEFLPEAPEYFNGYVWPTQGTVTSGYGWRWGRMHRGVDVAGPVGTPVVAAALGVVEQAGWNSGGYGNLVDIRHPDGSLTRYAHNSRLNVSAGQTVGQGQQIAEMGSTGYSTGPHLHFEIHVSGQGAVNPVAYLPTDR